jgi:hypothetical protein
MGPWERWLVPGILATIGVPFLVAGGVIRGVLPGSIAQQAQVVARLRVATAATLNERGAQVLIEGRVAQRMPPSGQPPLVIYNEYERVEEEDGWDWRLQRSYTPTLWVDLPGGTVEVMAGYHLRTAPAQVEGAYRRRYEGFRVDDPVLVLGTLRTPGNPAVVEAAEIGFETQATYLQALARDQVTARWLGLLFLVVGGGLVLGAVAAVYWVGRSRASG